MKLKTQACPTCNGSGSVPADDVGSVLMAEREKAGVQRVDVAEKMGVSASYLRDLEQGNRRWTNELLSSYQKALEGLSGVKA